MINRMYKTITVILLLLVLLVAVAACNNIPPDEQPHIRELSTAEAINQVEQLISSDIAALGQANEYSISFTMQVETLDSSALIDFQLSFNKNNPDATRLKLTSVTEDISTNLYYSESAMYIDKLGEEKAVLYGVSLNEIFNRIVGGIQDSSLSLMLASSFGELLEYDENSITMSLVGDFVFLKLYSLINEQIGGENILIDLFSIYGLTKNDFITASDPSLKINFSDDKLNSLTYSSNMSGKDILITVSNISVTSSSTTIDNFPESFTDYKEYSFTTFSISGNLTYTYNGESITPIKSTLSGVDMTVASFVKSMPYSIAVNVNPFTLTLDKIMVSLTLPKEMIGQGAQDSTIRIVSSFSDGKMYLDFSEIGIEKLAVDMDESALMGMFIINGVDSTVVDFLSLITDSITTGASENTITIALDEGKINQLLSSVGIENLFNILSATISFNLSGNNVVNIEGGIAFKSGDSIDLSASNAVIGLGAANISVDSNDYVNYEDVASFSSSNSGVLMLPTGVDGNVITSKFINSLTGYNPALTGYNRTINYNLMTNFTSSHIDIVLEFYSDSPIDNGFIISYNGSEEMLYVLKSSSDIYTNVYSITRAELDPNNAINILLASMASDLESVGLLAQLFNSSNLENKASVALNFLSSMIAESGAFTSALKTAVYQPANNNAYALTLFNNSIITVTPTVYSISFNSLKGVSSTVLSSQYNVFGTDNNISYLEMYYGTDSAQYTNVKKIAPSYSTIEYADSEALSGSGVVTYDIYGIPCLVTANHITASSVTSIKLVQGSEQYNDISLDAQTLGVSADLAQAIMLISKAELTLADSSVVTNVPITWLSDIESVLSAISFNTTTTLNYSYKDNLGNTYYGDIELIVSGITNNFNSPTSASFSILEYASYGNIDPRNLDSYPLYFDITNSTYIYASDIIAGTRHFNAATCYILDWNIASVIAKYSDSNWIAYENDTLINVSVSARNIFGYVKNFNNIKVSINKDEFNPADISLSVYGNSFADGISYNDQLKLLTIDPYICQELYMDYLYNVRLARVQLAGGSTREFDIIWDSSLINGKSVLKIYDMSDNVVDITMDGIQEGYVLYRIGDSIGGTQIIKLNVHVLKKSMKDWAIFDDGFNKIKSIDNVDPLKFSSIINQGMINGVSYVEFETDNVESIIIDTTYTTATINTGSIFYTISIRANEWVIKQGDTTIIGGTNLLNDIYSTGSLDFTLYMLEVISLRQQWYTWNSTYSARFTFAAGEIDSLTSDGLNYAPSTLDYSAYFGGIKLTVEVEFIAKSISINNLTPLFNEGEADFSILDEGAGVFSLNVAFDPYGSFDYTNVNLYPNIIRLSEGLNHTDYDINWNISNLLSTLSGINPYEGVANIPVVINIVRGSNNNITYTNQFTVYVSITRADITSSNYGKTGYYRTENDALNDYDSTRYINIGRISFNLASLNNGYLTLFNPRDTSSYAQFIGVSFIEGDALGMTDRWLPVSSWNISSITSYFGNNAINEIGRDDQNQLLEFLVTALVGNSYGGYQSLTFVATIDDTLSSSLSINEFTSIPQTLNENNQVVNATDSITYGSGAPEITFNPYLINIKDSTRYPAKVTLKSGSDITSEYQITNWDLTNVGATSFAGGTYTAVITVADVLKLNVTVKSIAMSVTSLKGAPSYSVLFNPLATGNAVLGNSTNASWKLEGNKIVYTNTSTSNKFLFSGNLKEMTLNIRFDISNIPTNTSSPKQLVSVEVGNDIGGYQPLIVPAYFIFDDLMIKEILKNDTLICSFTELYDYTFYSLPLPEPQTMDFKFYNNDNNYSAQLFTTGGQKTGLYYTWSDENNNRVDTLPYYVNVYSYMPALGLEYAILEQYIVVEQDISEWFIDMLQGKSITFEWTEIYASGANIQNVLIAELAKIGVNIDSYIAQFADLADPDGFTKFFAKSGTIVNSFNEPGTYTYTYQINETDRKYKGSTALSFEILKKDLYDNNILVFKNGATILGNAAAPVYISYTGSNIPMSVEIGAETDYHNKQIALSLLFSSNGGLTWTSTVPINVGEYLMKAQVNNQSTGYEHALYASDVVFTIIVQQAVINPTSIVISNSSNFTSNATYFTLVYGNLNGSNRTFTLGVDYDIYNQAEQLTDVSTLSSGTHTLILRLKGNYSGETTFAVVKP